MADLLLQALDEVADEVFLIHGPWLSFLPVGCCRAVQGAWCLTGVLAHAICMVGRGPWQVDGGAPGAR
jgi:hypothetical protein